MAPVLVQPTDYHEIVHEIDRIRQQVLSLEAVFKAAAEEDEAIKAGAPFVRPRDIDGNLFPRPDYGNINTLITVLFRKMKNLLYDNETMLKKKQHREFFNNAQQFLKDRAYVENLHCGVTRDRLEVMIENAKNEHVETIKVSENLSVFPQQILNISSLKSLDLSNNQLGVIPSEIINLRKLRDVNFSQNASLSFLPRTFSSLSRLSILNLSYCGFSKIPNEISGLGNLTELNLRGNSIVSIENLSNGNLVKIDLSHNRISSISLEIFENGVVPMLSHIDLSHNFLVILPEEILRIDQISELKIDGNALENPPENIANQGKSAMLKWWKWKVANDEKERRKREGEEDENEERESDNETEESDD